jgi:nifR3 family TIM-barrel protein
MFTEFISTEGLIRDADKSVQKLDIYEDERPIGIQIFGSVLESMMMSARIVEEAKPELLDINFGCPVKKVVCKMAGAGILQDIPRMVELTDAVVKSTNLPVTVKTRLGWDNNSIKIQEVAERLQDVGIQALSIHGRTRKQMYKGEADWTEIGKIKENPRIHIPIFGNGDIDSPEKCVEYKKRYGVDGVMIGRAAIGYPWIFREIKHFIKTGEHLPPPTVDERVDTALKHLKTSIAWKGDVLGVLETRRHYGSYFRGFRDIKQYRQILVDTMDHNELFDTLETIRERYKYEYVPE